MPLQVQLACLAGALAALVFAVATARASWAVAVAGAACAVTVARPALAADAYASGGAGLVGATLATAYIFRRRAPAVMAATAGWLAGAWAAVLRAEGAPGWAAVAVALAVPLFGVIEARRRPTFAPTQLVEDAMVVVALLSFVAAVTPGLVEGWLAAANLKAAGVDVATTPDVPPWALALSAAAVAAGASVGAWRRRLSR